MTWPWKVASWGSIPAPHAKDLKEIRHNQDRFSLVSGVPALSLSAMCDIPGDVAVLKCVAYCHNQ